MRKNVMMTVLVTAALIGVPSVIAMSAQTLTTLTVEPVHPTTGQPMGRLHFDHEGLVIDGVYDNGTPSGKLVFKGNELALQGYGDPPKVRLANESGSGAVSFNWIRPDGSGEEIFMIKGAVDQQVPGSPGGQLEFWIKRRLVTNDAAMRLMGVISAAYTENGEPVVRWHPNTVFEFGQGFGGTDYGYISQLTQLNNLSGTVNAAKYEDSQWLVTQNVNLDTTVSATMPIGPVQQLRIQLRRTSSVGTKPYVYVTVDGVPTSIWGYQPSSTTGEIVTAPIAPYDGSRTIQIYTSAQNGTVEIGSIRGI